MQSIYQLFATGNAALWLSLGLISLGYWLKVKG